MKKASQTENLFALKIRNGIFASIILNVLLVAFGLWVIPTALRASVNGITGLAGVLGVLIKQISYDINPVTRIKLLNGEIFDVQKGIEDTKNEIEG